MNLTIFGSTGGVGRELVAQAVARGHRVRAVSRRPVGWPAGVGRFVCDDVTTPECVRDATRGAEAVLSALGLRRRNPLNPWSAITSPHDLNARFARAMVAACGPVCRAIVISAAGVAESRRLTSGPMRWLIDRSNLRIAYHDLAAMERVYRASMIDWTAVRPTTLTNGPAARRTREVQRYQLTCRVSRRDLAAYLLDLAERRTVASSRTPMVARG